jgi:hypothetical protein
VAFQVTQSAEGMTMHGQFSDIDLEGPRVYLKRGESGPLTPGPSATGGPEQAGTTQPATTLVVPSTQPAIELAGTQWTGDMGVWQLRWQFDRDGKFILSRTRGINPMVHRGTWTMKDSHLVLRTTEYYEHKENDYLLDHMTYIKKNYLALKVEVAGNRLTVQGDLPSINFDGPRLTLKKADFPDMNTVKPPREKS